MLYYEYASQPIIRLGRPADEHPPRAQRNEPHASVVVARVRHLVQTTAWPLRDTGKKTGVTGGTISRWMEKYGWHRPPAARPSTRRPGARWKPNMIGRVLATRLRIQCERLVDEIEAAEHVDPAKLDEAI